MMRPQPRSFMRGITWRQTWYGPVRLTAMLRVHSSKLPSRNVLSARKPATLTAMSTPPSSPRAFFTNASTDALSVMSHFSATTLTPSLRAAAATSFSSFMRELVQMARLAPSPASASAE